MNELKLEQNLTTILTSIIVGTDPGAHEGLYNEEKTSIIVITLA